MSVTLSLNTPVPHTPIYDALLAERDVPLPEAEPGDVMPTPSYADLVETHARQLRTVAERAAEASEAYAEEADSVASDIGRIHETTCRDLRRMHHQAQINLGLVQVTNPAAYLDEIDVWDVARIHDVPPDMVDTAVKLPPRALQPQTPEEWLPVARKILDGMREEIDGAATHGSATVVGVDPATNDPEKTMVIAKVTVDEDGHPVTFSVHGSKPPLLTASHSPDDEAPLSMPPRYYEALRQLAEIEGDGTTDPEPTREYPALPPEYAARLAEERAVLAEKPVEPYFTALAEAYEHDVALALHGADDGERGDQALTDYIQEISPEITHQVMDGSDDPEHADDCDGCVADALKDPALLTTEGMQVIIEMLGLVCVDATMEQVEAWTVAQRAEAVNWASLTHLSAADNDVTVPPRPTFLPCDSTLDCTAAEHDGACLSVLGRVPVKFWICPDHRKGIVEWDGDIAVCMETSCKRTSETPREDGDD